MRRGPASPLRGKRAGRRKFFTFFKTRPILPPALPTIFSHLINRFPTDFFFRAKVTSSPFLAARPGLNKAMATSPLTMMTGKKAYGTYGQGIWDNGKLIRPCMSSPLTVMQQDDVAVPFFAGLVSPEEEDAIEQLVQEICDERLPLPIGIGDLDLFIENALDDDDQDLRLDDDVQGLLEESVYYPLWTFLNFINVPTSPCFAQRWHIRTTIWQQFREYVSGLLKDDKMLRRVRISHFFVCYDPNASHIVTLIPRPESQNEYYIVQKRTEIPIDGDPVLRHLSSSVDATTHLVNDQSLFWLSLVEFGFVITTNQILSDEHVVRALFEAQQASPCEFFTRQYRSLAHEIMGDVSMCDHKCVPSMQWVDAFLNASVNDLPPCALNP
jgi:hypothetical protein